MQTKCAFALKKKGIDFLKAKQKPVHIQGQFVSQTRICFEIFFMTCKMAAKKRATNNFLAESFEKFLYFLKAKQKPMHIQGQFASQIRICFEKKRGWVSAEGPAQILVSRSKTETSAHSGSINLLAKYVFVLKKKGLTFSRRRCPNFKKFFVSESKTETSAHSGSICKPNTYLF